MVRRCVLSVLLLSAAGARGEVPSDAGASGFRLEGKPAIDDVFGDANDYRRTIDRFLELTAQMQTMRDEFARSVQAVLAELVKLGERDRGKRRCPQDAVSAPYA